LNLSFVIALFEDAHWNDTRLGKVLSSEFFPLPQASDATPVPSNCMCLSEFRAEILVFILPQVYRLDATFPFNFSI